MRYEVFDMFRWNTLAALLLVASSHAIAEEKPLAWRTDYDVARKEATEKGLPLFVKVFSDSCVHCQRLDAGPLRNPAVLELLSQRFVPLLIDGTKSPKLVEALHIQAYPTMIIATTDGKIFAFLEGYREAPALTDQLQRALAVETPDWMARDFQESVKAIGNSDYAKAIPLLKAILEDGKDRPVQTKAKSVLDEIEQQAAGRLLGNFAHFYGFQFLRFTRIDGRATVEIESHRLRHRRHHQRIRKGIRHDHRQRRALRSHGLHGR